MVTLDFHDTFSAWSHFLWALLAVPAGYILVKQGKKTSLLIFILCVIFCYTMSGLYHSVAYEYVPLFMTLDFIGIFLLIAGSYNVVLEYYFTGRQRALMLTTIWGLAFIGIAYCVVYGMMNGVIFMLMAWGMLAVFTEFTKELIRRRMYLVFLGGCIYTIGAVLEHLHIPGGIYHEVFHLFVMAGTSCHYIFFWRNIR